MSISRFPALPPYLSIIPPDGIVGEGIGGHKRPKPPPYPFPRIYQSFLRTVWEGRPGTIRKLMPGLSSPISLHSPWPAPAYSSTAHPTPPDRPPYCSLRTGGRDIGWPYQEIIEIGPSYIPSPVHTHPHTHTHAHTHACPAGQ